MTTALDVEIAALRAAESASYSQREAAELLSVTLEAMRARVWTGSVPSVHIGGTVRIPRSVVQSLRTSSDLLTRATEMTTTEGGDAS